MAKVENFSIIRLDGTTCANITHDQFPNLRRLFIGSLVADKFSADPTAPVIPSPFDFLGRDTEEIHIDSMIVRPAADRKRSLRIEHLRYAEIEDLIFPGETVEEKLSHPSIVITRVRHLVIGTLVYLEGGTGPILRVKSSDDVNITNLVARA